MQKLINLSEKISKYLLAVVLVIVPLLPKFPLFRVTGTYVSIRFEDILMLVLALSLIPRFFLDFEVIWKDEIVRAFIIFFAVTFISVFWGVFVTDTATFKLAFLHWARRIEYIVPFFVAYLLIPKGKIFESIEFYLKILMIVVVVTFIYGFGQRYLNFPIIITQNEEYSKGIALLWTPGSHINSTFAGHYDLAAFIVMIMPIFFGTLFSIKGKTTKFFIIVSSIAGLWLLINSVSRMAQAAYLLAITTSLILLKKYKGWIFVSIVSIVAMLMSSSLSDRFTQAIKYLYERVVTHEVTSFLPIVTKVRADEITLSVRELSTPTPAPVSNLINDVSIAIRYNVEWPRAIRAFIKNPILGTGYSSIGLATDNDYLRMLGETGILGFAAFSLVVLILFKVFWSYFKNSRKFNDIENCFILGTVGGILGTLSSALLIDLFEASKFAIIFWLLVGCSVKLIKSNINEK